MIVCSSLTEVKRVLDPSKILVIYFLNVNLLLLLAGFGNLRGQVELWEVEKRKLISKCDASDTTLLQWCPDGMHFLTATTAPRLRIGNGYELKIIYILLEIGKIINAFL